MMMRLFTKCKITLEIKPCKLRVKLSMERCINLLRKDCASILHLYSLEFR